MLDQRTYTVFPSNLSLQEAFRASREILRELGYITETAGHPSEYKLEIDSTRSLASHDWDEFVTLLGRYPSPIHVHGHGWWDGEKGTVFLSIDLTRTSLLVAVRSRDLPLVEFLHRRLQDNFHASNPVRERSAALARRSLKKTIFLAHRFDEQGTKAAATVARILSHCGFFIVDGHGYEAGAIPDKVMERIKCQDIFLAVVTPGDVTWIMSEAAFAHAHDKYVVFLAEEGMDVKKGILGADYEHLLFPPGNIEKAFSDLLYALPS
jgi:hypothetical protein